MYVSLYKEFKNLQYSHSASGFAKCNGVLTCGKLSNAISSQGKCGENSGISEFL